MAQGLASYSSPGFDRSHECIGPVYRALATARTHHRNQESCPGCPGSLHLRTFSEENERPCYITPANKLRLQGHGMVSATELPPFWHSRRMEVCRVMTPEPAWICEHFLGFVLEGITPGSAGACDHTQR